MAVLATSGQGPVHATTGQTTPTQVAQEVVRQGGSVGQAYVAAALTTGIESNGTTNDKNPSSTACGLFQFLTSTWLGNGGGNYAPTACAATMEQQVAVFLHATANGYGDWRPDLVPGLDPNSTSSYGVNVTAPQAGSKVANAIAQLAAGGLTKVIGPVPNSWVGNTGGAGGVLPASPTPIPGLPNQGVNVGGSFQSWQDALTGFFNDLVGGFGIGWKGVLGILLGILFIGFGAVFLFHTQEKEAVRDIAPAAAA